jgi:peptide/nickel transport system permease protein
MALFGSGILLLIIILALTGWMDIARLVRAEVNALKQQSFILKARAIGLRTDRIIVKHLLPNIMVTVIAFSILRMADIILIESALSFIGLGVQPPTASWGSIINDGRQIFSSAWWIVLFPGLAIVLSTASLNIIGRGIKNRVE